MRFDVSMAVTESRLCAWPLKTLRTRLSWTWIYRTQMGIRYAEPMRRTSTLRTVPIVMLTALSDKRNEIAGLRAGADDYLTKPIDTERLQARLENALSRNIRELDANPLTHLPGNTSILQEMERRLRKQEAFAVIYSDLNNFKAFNDRYGFLRGDQAIKLAAQCLVLSVEGRVAQSVVMPGNWFIGHVEAMISWSSSLRKRRKTCPEKLFSASIPRCPPLTIRKIARGDVFKGRRGRESRPNFRSLGSPWRLCPTGTAGFLIPERSVPWPASSKRKCQDVWQERLRAIRN